MLCFEDDLFLRDLRASITLQRRRRRPGVHGTAGAI